MADFSRNRKSLAEQVADFILESLIQQSGLQVLPGERLIAERAGVSRQTVQEALRLLERQGVIMPKEGRKARRVANTYREKPKSGMVLIYLRNSGLIRSAANVRNERRYIEIWEANGGTVIVKEMDFILHKDPPPAFFERMVTQYGMDAIVLTVAPLSWVNGAHQAGIPCLCEGGLVPNDGSVSLIAYDAALTMRHVLRYLKTRGHERILVPCSTYFASLHLLYQAVYQEEMCVAEADVENYIPRFVEHQPKIWMAYWERAFARARPTAVVCADTPILISLLSFCNSKGLKIPDDISLICLDYSENLRWYQPSIQMMKYPHERAAKDFERWIKGGLKSIGIKLYPMEIVKEADSVRSLV
ncbi:substrate-binding domain-containing protein [Rubritalea squalenifaciens]|nr:substrate-binding domain-containing protein [Rubritalea squalenifaciens]